MKSNTKRVYTGVIGDKRADITSGCGNRWTEL